MSDCYVYSNLRNFLSRVHRYKPKYRSTDISWTHVIKLLSCLRSDIVSLDTLIVLLTYLLTYLLTWPTTVIIIVCVYDTTWSNVVFIGSRIDLLSRSRSCRQPKTLTQRRHTSLVPRDRRPTFVFFSPFPRFAVLPMRHKLAAVFCV